MNVYYALYLTIVISHIDDNNHRGTIELNSHVNRL